MPEGANAELARRAIDAVRRADHREAERGFHADAVWHNTAQFPGQRNALQSAGLGEEPY